MSEIEGAYSEKVKLLYVIDGFKLRFRKVLVNNLDRICRVKSGCPAHVKITNDKIIKNRF